MPNQNPNRDSTARLFFETGSCRFWLGEVQSFAGLATGETLNFLLTVKFNEHRPVVTPEEIKKLAGLLDKYGCENLEKMADMRPDIKFSDFLDYATSQYEAGQAARLKAVDLPKPSPEAIKGLHEKQAAIEAALG